MTQSFSDDLNPTQGANTGQDVGTVRALSAPCFEQSFLVKPGEHGFKEAALRLLFE